MPQPIGHVDDVSPSDVVAASPDQRKQVSIDTSTSKTRTPPPGLAHSAYRGFVSTMQGLDQTMANAMAIIDKVPGVTPGTFGKDSQAEADRRAKELANDKRVPQTRGEKLTEGIVSGAGGAIPYLAAEGPVGAFTVGALENADQGPVAALKGGARAALLSGTSKALGKTVSKAVNKTPLLKDAPEVVKRAVSGATTSAALPGSGDRGAQAILGGAAGASQRKPKDNNEVRAQRLMAATGKTGGDAFSAYKVVGPALEETAKLTGKNNGKMTVPELKDTVDGTLKRLQTEYRQYMDPIKNQQVWGTPVSDAIENSIKEVERNGKTAEAEKIGNALQKRADEFKKQFSVNEMDNLRELYFENLHGTSKENLQERSSADVRADRIAEAAIKDVLYPLVDQQAQVAGKPAGYVRGTLKTQQANLIQLKDALIKRTKELSEKEAIRQGTPIHQRGNITLAAHPSGSFVGSIHGLMNILFGDPDSSKEANKRVADSFPVKTSKSGDRVGAVVAGAPRDRTPPSGKKIKMRAPNGQVSEVDSSQVEHYKSLGAAVVQ